MKHDGSEPTNTDRAECDGMEQFVEEMAALDAQGQSCDACGKETPCFDTRDDKTMCRDCAMRYDDEHNGY